MKLNSEEVEELIDFDVEDEEKEPIALNYLKFKYNFTPGSYDSMRLL